MMSLFAPENSPASSVLPPVGNTTPRAAAAAPSPVTDPPSPMAVPPPEINAPPVIAPPQLLPPILPPENSSTPPAPALMPPEILTPSPSPPVPKPESSPPPTSQPDNPPETSPPLLSPPGPPPEISPPSPENAPPPSGELAAPPALADKFPPPPPKSVPMKPPPINNISPPTGTTPAKPQPEPRTTPTSPPPVSTVNLPPRNPDRPVKSPGTRVPPSPPHVATPAKPNVPALETPPPNYQTGSVPPASSLQPPELHGSSVPPALSSNVSSPSSVVPPLNPGDLSPPGSNGSVPMSIGDERASVGRSSISKGIVIGGIIGGILIVAVIGWLVCVYLKGRNRRKKGDKGRNRVPLAGSKGDADLPPNLKQNVSPPASHVVTVLASSLPSPSLEGKVGDSSLANSVQSPRALGVKFGILSDWFTYDELVKATDNFSEANLIGQGGFGHVYKGVFPSGKEVAVKQLNVDSKQGEREFQAEVETISRVHHKHLVSLIGYCITGSDRLLVYEFVPNNTLEFHLHRKKQPVMDWTTRMRIAIGSAKGLAYLHEDCQPAIIHRDIKASNILLDFKFEAKVSDFGLAKSFPDNGTSITHISTRVMGTFGYLAPEYASSGQVTERSDVYSYGVMLLELLTGRPPISTSASLLNESLVGWAWPLLIQSLEDGIYDTFVDPKLLGCYNSNEMIRMVACATACVQHSARLRPRMSQVTRALEGDISFTDIIEGIQARYVFYGSSESSRYDVHQYNNQRKKFERILASQEHAATGYSQSTSEYGLHPSDSSSESRKYQRPKESVASNDDIC